MSGLVIDAFGGPGGASEGMRQLGIDSIGIEWDAAACATRAKAGHRTVRADVASFPLEQLAGKVEGLWMSPPCPTFSTAGKGDGRAELAYLHSFTERVWKFGWHDPQAWHNWSDPRTPLVLEPLRWVEALRPEWVALEQVPPVLGLWESYCAVWQDAGYSVWCGVLNAADYGVPQTRRRAVLMGSRSTIVEPPTTTHAREPQLALFGPSLEPWVSMAAALGWMGEVGFPRLDDTGSSPDGYSERDWRSTADPALLLTEKARSWVRRERSGDRAEEGFDPHDNPSQSLTSKARSWVVRTGENSMVTSRTGSRAGDGGVEPYERCVDEPAPTLDGKVGSAWYLTRPATTVCADPRLGNPGHRDRDGGEPQFAPDALRLSAPDALVLQGFPRDYPVTGSRSAQFQQIGNAVPPPLARAVVSALGASRVD